jgi:hypothetical protein
MPKGAPEDLVLSCCAEQLLARLLRYSVRLSRSPFRKRRSERKSRVARTWISSGNPSLCMGDNMFRCRCSNRAWTDVLVLMPQPKLKSKKGAFSLKTFQLEFAQRTRRNESFQLRVRRFAQAARFTQ